MKQYTTADQTAKLIELGFEKPSNTVVKEEPIYREGSIIDWKIIGEEGSYSIGELIEMLPMAIDKNMLEIWTPATWDEWGISYGWHEYDENHYLLHSANKELIDALYDMVVKLKEEGVI